jgi:CRP-like cAMP-binding protein
MDLSTGDGPIVALLRDGEGTVSLQQSLAQLVARAHWADLFSMQVPKDTMVYKQQDEATCLYFVWEGELQVVRRLDLQHKSLDQWSNESSSLLQRDSGGKGMGDAPPRKCSKSVQLAVLRKGEFFGEVEVFNDIPRTSTVKEASMFFLGFRV